jgi:hypothetical protein
MSSRIKYVLPAILGMLFGLFLNPARATETPVSSEPEVKHILAKIKDREKGLQTFIAKMQQTKNTRMFKEPLYSEGEIYFNHTGQLLLKIIHPSPVFILIQNDRIYTHYPDYGKTEETYIGPHVLEKYFGLGKSTDAFYDQYSIQLLSNPSLACYHLMMRPKDDRMAKRIDAIDVTVQTSNLLPDTIHILERDGDDTSIVLEFISINQPLPKGIFDIDLGDPGPFNQ